MSRHVRRVSTVVLALLLAVSLTGGPALAAPREPLGAATPSAPVEQRDLMKWYQVQPSYNGEPEFLFAIAERLLGDGNRNAEIFERNKGRVQADGKALEKPEVLAPGWVLFLPADAKGEGVQTGELWYRVQKEFGGEPEFLHAIATRFLRDGNRYTEIFELNKGRRQPDGTAMTTPDKVAPGWILLLPVDASGVTVSAGPLPADAIAAASAAPATPTSAAASQPAPGAGFPVLLVVLIVLGALLVAGAVIGLLLLRRRRAAAAPAPGTAAPTRTFDTAASWTVDRALSVLVAGARSAGRPVPPIYGVSLDEQNMALRLAAPDTDPVAPWEPAENGRVWRAQLRDLQALPAVNAASPTPRLVTLGTAGGTRELIDLGQATGVISLSGDAAASRALVAAWAEELTGSPWSTGVRVVAGDIRPQLPAGDRLAVFGSVRDAIAEAEGERPEESYALRGTSSGGPGVLILGSAPGSRDLERVQALLTGPWVVVVLGQTRYDRWRFTIAADGRLEAGALGLTVYARSR
ncbi:hypothetical protein ACIA8K_22035 [Catenuloplanes sp. NPDC051500]|uniref:hypothetical protein n=1 Tax=Catenuloplanes sp. NPDC051500 TaxID=3363959 RepID=UPI00378742B7